MKTRELAVASTTSVCVIDGCDRNAVYTVSKDDRVWLVCRKCAGELVGVFGWRVI